MTNDEWQLSTKASLRAFNQLSTLNIAPVAAQLSPVYREKLIRPLRASFAEATDHLLTCIPQEHRVGWHQENVATRLDTKPRNLRPVSISRPLAVT